MDITDTASGRAYFMEPGKMRWEYVEPEPQQIITDGKRLWVYKPLEEQVLTGDVSSLFEDGRGVSFLSAIRRIAEENQVSFTQARERKGYHILALAPKERKSDLKVIYIYVSSTTGLVEEIETVNFYDDITRIMFSEIRLGGSVDPSLFTFNIPEGADVLMMDNRQ